MTTSIFHTRKCLIYSYSVFRHKQISLGHIFLFCLSSQTDSLRIQTLCRHFMTTTILNTYRSHIDYPHCRLTTLDSPTIIYSYSVFRHKQISLGHIFFFCLRIQTLCRHFITTTILNTYRSHIHYPHCRLANNVGFTNDQKQMVSSISVCV
jgi:hypothetical protein